MQPFASFYIICLLPVCTAIFYKQALPGEFVIVMNDQVRTGNLYVTAGKIIFAPACSLPVAVA
jgi:hypothetical protein